MQKLLWGLLAVVMAVRVDAAEVVQLGEQNWDQYVPQGKEVDAIYGDYVLRSDRVVAVIAEAVDGRKANMTVQGVGGSVIDLTRREPQSDQLSCYYPHDGTFTLTGPTDWPQQWDQTEGAARLAFVAKSNSEKSLERTIGFELVDGQDYLTVHTLLVNKTDQPQTVKLIDGIRADGEFTFGHDEACNMTWCYDRYWRGAYGLTSQQAKVREEKSSNSRRPLVIEYVVDGNEEGIVVPANGTVTFTRQLIPAADTLQAAATSRALQDEELLSEQLEIRDANGPVAGADIEIKQGEISLGSTRTDDEGKVEFQLPAGDYDVMVSEQSHETLTLQTKLVAGENQFVIELGGAAPGFIEGKIVDESGAGVPSKLIFTGQGVADPNFGPDSAIHGVRNVWYTADGEFRVQVRPGSYEVLVSHGPEFDAVQTKVEVQPGKATHIEEQLTRSVDTSGWISAELHSHSSPSGDNTSHQRGRVLNLLAEQIEFIPCTEHQRITSYMSHLEHFDAVERVLTCTGMELTGSPLPINHQNAFPLVEHRHHQDGGGPLTHSDPEVQIARVAMWDDNSDKVVQINHPNIAQMVGDADLNGEPDEGFRKMFHFADVMEVHPPEMIFDELMVGEKGWDGRGTVILNWMQLLNLGYRVPGVVNTDAHWNFHGSGWLRNYIRSTTDDPAEADLMEICHALEHGHVVMSNGPFMEVEASAAGKQVGPGEDLPSGGSPVELHVKVQCPNWLDVNRVQVFVNGRPAEQWNFTRKDDASKFQDGVTKFDQTITLPLDKDAHVIVATGGVGLQLGHNYGPDAGKVMPVAVSNPIFVDVDGGGFSPNGDMLGKPLPVEPNHKPTHGHDH